MTGSRQPAKDHLKHLAGTEIGEMLESEGCSSTTHRSTGSSATVGQTQQTEITRRLAAWAAIIAVPTAVAGIYGMNFENMPELKWAYGYYLAVAVVAIICGTLYWRLRRVGWL